MKTFIGIEDQIKRLESRNVIISDYAVARQLQHITTQNL